MVKPRKLPRAIWTLCIASIAVTCAAATPPDRRVAVTIDDLPAGGANWMSAATITEMTTKLLTGLKKQSIPAVGFVNENKLYKLGEVDERIRALAMWLESGTARKLAVLLHRLWVSGEVYKPLCNSHQLMPAAA